MAAHQTRKTGERAKAQTIAKRQAQAAKRGTTTTRAGRATSRQASDRNGRTVK